MSLKTAEPFARSGERGIALNNDKKFYSLRWKLFCGILVSLVIAAIAFLICYTLGNTILDKTIYGRPFMNSMADKKFAQLQEYVKKETVTQSNFRLLDIWCNQEKKTYLAIYSGENIIYDSLATSKNKLIIEDYDASLENPERKYSLILSDGKKTTAYLYYFEGDAFYYWTIFLSSLISFIVFSVSFTFLVHRKLRYIQQLKDELNILAGGDLTYNVTVNSNDELGELAHGIEKMRQSVLSHQKNEEKARLANSQLVTTMSHDLRTPMTSLLVYLELLSCGKYENEEQQNHFIDKSLAKTVQIKDMADKLFEYFLVYSSEWVPPDTEIIDADELLMQLWDEYIFSLENQGFKVNDAFGELNGFLDVNIDLIRRTFDNLYSNIVKYADPSIDVKVTSERVNTDVQICIVNKISKERKIKESSNIGLNTCIRILNSYGGELLYEELNGYFSVHATIPLLRK